MPNIIQMLKTMLIYNYRFAYTYDSEPNISNKIIGFGLIDSDNYYLTNYSFGQTEYNISPNRIIINPSEYVSLVLIHKSNTDNLTNTFNINTGFIWSKKHISDESDIVSIYNNSTSKSSNNDDIKIINFDSADLNTLISQSEQTSYYIDIYGLKNKLLFKVDYLNNLNINQINDHKKIKYILDIWFRYNLFEISSIYGSIQAGDKNNSNYYIRSTFYDQNNSLRFTQTDTQYDKSINNHIIDIFFKLGTFNDDKKIDIVNSTLKTYSDNYNIIMITETSQPTNSQSSQQTNSQTNSQTAQQTNSQTNSDLSTIIVNKFILKNKINVTNHNLLFTYNYPILLYSNYENI
jgi:hypothetical protein